jgi:uncharacterized protein (TIGR03083 family)
MSSPARPVTELDKSDVLSGLFDTWDSLDRLLTGLSEEQWQTPTPLPGWSVHNVVAHIIGTDRYCRNQRTGPISVSRHWPTCATRRRGQRVLDSSLSRIRPTCTSGSARLPPSAADA